MVEQFACSSFFLVVLVRISKRAGLVSGSVRKCYRMFHVKRMFSRSKSLLSITCLQNLDEDSITCEFLKVSRRFSQLKGLSSNKQIENLVN